MTDQPVSANATPSLRKTIRECVGDLCKCLADKINQLAMGRATHSSGTKGLAQRFTEQVQKGAAGPGTPSWNNHQQILSSQQDNLNSHLREYDARGCGGPGGGTPLYVGARAWGQAPLPTQADWDANNVPYEGLTGSLVGDAALGVAGAALFVFGGEVVLGVGAIGFGAWKLAN